MFDFTSDGSGIVTFSGAYEPRQSLQNFLGQVRTWSRHTGERVGEPFTWDATMPPRVLSDDRRFWTLGPTGSNDRQARIFDVQNKRIEYPELGPADGYPGGPISRDGQFLVFQVSKTAAILWDRHERRACGTIPFVGHALAFSPDARLIAAAGQNDDGWSVIRIFDRTSLREISCLRAGEFDDIYQLDFSPDGAFLVATVGDKPSDQSHQPLPWTLRCWEIKSGYERYSIPWVHLRRFAFHPNVSTLLIERDDPRHRLEWCEISTGMISRRVEVGGGNTGSSMWRLQLAPDGKRIVVDRSSSEPGLFEQLADRLRVNWPFASPTRPSECCLYDVESGESLGVVPAEQACWSPDGQTLATPMNSERPFSAIGLWDIPPRKSLTWLAAGAAILALPIALIARRRVRRLRAA
jgi:WD40 repeat protein